MLIINIKLLPGQRVEETKVLSGPQIGVGSPTEAVMIPKLSTLLPLIAST